MRRRMTWFVAATATLLAVLLPSGQSANTVAEVTLTVATPAPATVTPGHNVAYFITAHSNATSNVTHLSISAPSSAGSTVPFPFSYVATDRPDICTAPTNDFPAADSIRCNIGTFTPGSETTIALVFSVPTTFSNDTQTPVDFAASISYSGGSNNPNSTRTSGSNSQRATVGTLQNTTKGFVISSVGDVLATVPVANGPSAGNPQSGSASVNANSAPGFGVVGTVQEVSHPTGDTTTNCGAGFSCWGQTEVVTLTDTSGDVALSAPSTLIVRTDSSEIPSGVNKNNIQWFHNGGQLPSCTNTPASPSNNGCVRSVQKLSDNDLLTTIEAFHHGQYRP